MTDPLALALGLLGLWLGFAAALLIAWMAFMELEIWRRRRRATRRAAARGGYVRGRPGRP